MVEGRHACFPCAPWKGIDRLALFPPSLCLSHSPPGKVPLTLQPASASVCRAGQSYAHHGLMLVKSGLSLKFSSCRYSAPNVGTNPEKEFLASDTRRRLCIACQSRVIQASDPESPHALHSSSRSDRMYRGHGSSSAASPEGMDVLGALLPHSSGSPP